MDQAQLTAKLKQYEANLVASEQKLISDPNNKELQQLRDNLREYIDLTKDLLGIKDNSSLAIQPQTIATKNVGILKKVEVGQYVQASCTHTGSYLNGIVTEITAGGTACKVNFLGYNQTEIVAISSMRAPAFLKAADIKEGMEVEGVWSGDGFWYAAVIDSISEDGKHFNVTYTQYGNKETLDVKHLRLPPSKVVTKPDKKRAAEEEDSEDFVIPEKLKILPSDSEAVRATKKKKIHALKHQHRQRQLELEKDKKAKSWNSFAAKAGSKTVRGFLSTGKKESIFKTTEEGKVGVTGSGKGTTNWKQVDPHSVKKAVNAAGLEEEDD
mmetsp:Transcript_29241/g.76769  ORF Transcript_29241/g.76769 Transcript_29241/m.76769 type:complete len:326 (-) Transcript_29241:141-1118(-)|eukprot:CAMPEP_0113699204 /NCGR_PEP_ID=MMETSP0038_2-20120614/23162_1 /TAXON_ID=2898 /ORGANISM="Cryptomonas paramecium" /LENGTH=325 /DNA_ID=CAMNT_0000622505 /DNA_START=103 /DNA_END=1080 /DNA_ORIENTATION=- /assembly_acc=CAM_ASM_000170